MQRYDAISRSVVSLVTMASHTWVVRPVWRGDGGRHHQVALLWRWR